MGTFLSQTSKGQPLTNKEIILHLKNKSMQDVLEITDFIFEVYPNKQLLVKSEFIDIFSLIFQEYTERAFGALANSQQLVDIYEALSIVAILNQDDIDARISFVFQLFDFDGSGAIDVKEFVMSCTSVIQGLVKLTALPCPTLN